MSFALDILLLAGAWGHVLAAPYTKVEESFNLHATHDILMYGVTPDALPNYDHFTFSGPIPRSFVGSLVLATLSRPALLLASSFDLLNDKSDMQVVVRLVLASVNALGLMLIRRAVQRRFGRLASLFFALLTLSQFHVLFWMGRTLPNMFALFPVNIAIYLLFDREKNAIRPAPWRVHSAFSLLTFAGVVLRAEIAALLIPLALQSLLSGHVSFIKLVRTGVLAALVSIGITVFVDSYFWKTYPLWPEFAGIYFNVYEGKSADWGVSPAHAYFSSHLPRLLLLGIPLTIFGALIDSRAREVVLPALCAVGLLSGLGHKEWRFIVYTVPLFNFAAARGARAMASMRKGALIGRIGFLIVTGILVANTAATIISTIAASANYPGGVALMHFNNQTASTTNVHVHISNLAAQTGSSLFLQTNAPPYPPYLHFKNPPAHNWTYSKTENLSDDDLTRGPFTHIIAEKAPSGWSLSSRSWRVMEVIPGFTGWNVDFDVKKLVERYGWMGLLEAVPQMKTEEKLWIAERATLLR
ncbi:glycosyltransferase family 22 protein [Peniophora sp. CONT]|nr:glycosyltransferase family 22 protein [Peniophora sp. CONT]